MPNPNYNHDITVYHKNGTAFERRVLSGVFFHAQQVTTTGGTSASVNNVYVVRIPKNGAGIGYDIKAGDIIVHGVVADEVTGAKGATATDILAKYKPDAFKVTAVSDNTHGFDPHIKIGG